VHWSLLPPSDSLISSEIRSGEKFGVTLRPPTEIW